VLEGLERGVTPRGADLARAAALVVGLSAAGGLFQYLRGRWAALASEAIVERIRNRIYGHLERLACTFHDRADTGDLVQRCTSDVETVRVFLAAQIVEIGRSTLLVLLVVPIMLSIDARLTLASLGLFPFLVVAATIFFRRVKALFLQVDEAEGEMTTVLQENLTGVRVVRAFARGAYECGKFAERNGAHRDCNFRLIRLLATFWALSDMICLGQFGLSLIFGGMLAARGAVSIGAVYAFLTYVGMVVGPLRHLGRVLVDTGKATVSLERLREVLREMPESPDGEAPEALAGAVDVEGLAFGYRDGSPVLRDLSLGIAPGETVALLGPPGAGKSTLVQLLLRLFDYEQGSIRLDGRELRTLSRAFVRSQIGVVLQEPFLYSKTIGANVRVGWSQAPDERVVASTVDAAIHGSIEEFAHGYETLVGERGVTLSGGQRQRLALARALVKDPAILVLDDALSAVDTHTEAQILEALRRRHGRRTTILIAHRLSSVLHADRILVLHGGAVVQAGTHAELARADGPYRRLWNIQGALEEELDADLAAGGRS